MGTSRWKPEIGPFCADCGARMTRDDPSEGTRAVYWTDSEGRTFTDHDHRVSFAGVTEGGREQGEGASPTRATVGGTDE